MGKKSQRGNLKRGEERRKSSRHTALMQQKEAKGSNLKGVHVRGRDKNNHWKRK